MKTDSEHPLVLSIRRQRTEISELEARHKREMSDAKEELRRLARSLSGITNMADRLKVARVCRDQRLCSQRDLAWALFGNENRGWSLRYALRPMTRPCNSCGADVQTNKTNFEGSHVLCERCAQRRSEALATSEAQRERGQAERKRRRAQLKAKAKNHLTEDEILELADIVIAELRLSD